MAQFSYLARYVSPRARQLAQVSRGLVEPKKSMQVSRKAVLRPWLALRPPWVLRSLQRQLPVRVTSTALRKIRAPAR